MYRKLASAVLIASAINAKYALALGLGGMTMHSALNQPLDAEISLSSVGDLDKSQILITLASPDDYLKAGVDRSFFLFDIKFDVVLDGKGGGVVKLHSTKRLNEPYLDLLLEAKWPSGRSLRAYTTLVDLPVYAESASAQVDIGDQSVASSDHKPATESGASSSSSVSVSSNKSPAVQNSTSKASASRSYRAVNVSGDEYQIQPNETLSHIANKLNPGSGVTLNQTMLAIQKMNPHAFVRNNINLIKAGAVLRVPTTADVKQISSAAAAQSVAEQNMEWRGVQLDATGSTESLIGQDSASEEGHLSLTSAGSGVSNGNGQVTGDVARLQQTLSSTKENLDSVKTENKDLNARVGALSSEVNQLKRMIELKDAELAALQKNLGKESVVGTSKKEQSLLKQKEDVLNEEQPVTVEKAVVKAADVDVSKKEVAAEVSVDAQKPVEKPVSKKEPQAKDLVEKESGLFEKIKANPLYLGVIALVLIFGVVAFLFRRKAQAERQSIQENDIGNFEFDHSMDNDLSTDDFDSQEVAEELDSAEYADSADVLDSDNEQPTTMQTTDPVGEADIYIAYGRYDQAAELLLNAILKSPNNVDLRSKLLEVYVESGNRSGFQQQYLELRTLGHSAAISNAKELLSSADNVSDWLDDLPVEEATYASVGSDIPASTVETLDAVEDELDLDLNLDHEAVLDDYSFDDISDSDVSGKPQEANSDDVELLDLDLSGEGADFSGDDFNFSESSESPNSQEAADEHFSLDLSDTEFDTSADDLLFELGSVEESASSVSEFEEVAPESDLSFDLPDDFEIEVDPVTESTVDDSLSFDDLDMSFADVDVDEGSLLSPSGMDESFNSSDDMSFDGLDFSDESLVVASEVEDDNVSLDFTDMDLEDGSGLVGSEPDSKEDSLPEDVLEVENLKFESDFEFGSDANESPATDFVETEFEDIAFSSAPVEIVAEDQVEEVNEVQIPHVSLPIATLESEDLEFLTDGDEVSTKLDLAQAYVDLGDVDGARDILLEVMKEGREEQKAEAAALLDSLD